MDKQFFTDRGAEVKFFATLTLLLLLMLVVSSIFGWKVGRRDFSVPSEAASRPFPEVSLEAKAAYVYDIRTGEVLFAKNENIRLPLASLTKIMSALVAWDLSPGQGVVTISAEALAAEGDNGLRRDEKWSLQNLLDFSLVTSSNDGMRAVALALGALSRANADAEEIISDFVREMNLKAGELDLKNTYFWNETGLDLPTQAGKAGAYGTAKDMSTLLEYILVHHPMLFEATKEATTTLQSLDSYMHVATNTNSIVGLIPGLLVSKTGFTDTAGGNLAIVFDPGLGRPITVTILGSTEQGRFADVKNLIDATMAYISGN